MNRLCFVICLLFLTVVRAVACCEDDLLKNIPEINFKEPYVNLNYNYEDCDVLSVPLKIVKDIKNESSLQEGEIIEFIVKKDVFYNNKILIKEGEIITSKVETVISSGMNGIPANIILGSFEFKDKNRNAVLNETKNKFMTFKEIYGQDRSLFVFPLKWALTPIPPTGSLTNFIKGGHAKIKQKDTVLIYYHPNW